MKLHWRVVHAYSEVVLAGGQVHGLRGELRIAVDDVDVHGLQKDAIAVAVGDVAKHGDATLVDQLLRVAQRARGRAGRRRRRHVDRNGAPALESGAERIARCSLHSRLPPPRHDAQPAAALCAPILRAPPRRSPCANMALTSAGARLQRTR
ncbi:hypothetical protein FGB62_53g122 [Gracilaria domingensis]|nr:hypothetical protein FGB62_53g122 [Gracilaria domingensis]